MKVSICTLGCKVNQYESDCMAKILSERGYSVCEGLVFADAYIVNTCAVTAEAERKSRQMLSRIKKINPLAKITVTGCASQKNSAPFIKDSNVKYVNGCAQKYSLEFFPNIDSECDCSQIFRSQTESRLNITELPKVFEDGEGPFCFRERAFVKIQDGCNNFCSYCIIPYLRGRSRSAREETIVNECLNIKRHTREIVLTAINLSEYGKDIGTDLASLVRKLSDINCRFRLGSLEAGAINEKLLFEMKRAGFCPHFHLSLQSGDAGVLKSMNRKYTPEEFMKKIELIKKYFKDSSLTTDIIVGFPTETRQAFENTVKFVKEAEFSDIHIFPYSPREKTAAYKLKPLDKSVLKERAEKLAEIKKELLENYINKFVGKTLNVLAEEKKDNFYFGYSENYLYVKIKCDDLKIGEIYKVKILRNNKGVPEGVLDE